MPRAPKPDEQPADDLEQTDPLEETTPDPDDTGDDIDPTGFIDPTDQYAVAAYIDQFGLEAFQAERLRQVGTIYG